MLKIKFLEKEYYNEEKNEFFYKKECEIFLEHSLLSISKWESHLKKPFLFTKEKTKNEILYYIYCMQCVAKKKKTIRELEERLTKRNIKDIQEYIDDSHTATTITNLKQPQKKKQEIVTSEIIYYWMFVLNVPMDFQKWHLNRLLTLINVINIKNEQANPKKKMSKKDILMRNRKINEERKKQLNTKG